VCLSPFDSVPYQSVTVSKQVIYSRTDVRQFSYARRSYDIDTTSFAIHETWRTYEWREYERMSAYVV